MALIRNKIPAQYRQTYCLTTQERLALQELVKVLEWFEYATNQLQGDGVTISRVYPVVRTLLAKLDETSESQAKYTKKIRQELRSRLRERFGALQDKDVCVVSTFLDPKFGISAFELEKQAQVKG